jgi:hypothetical protein
MSNGDIYEGQFMNGKPNGQGKVTSDPSKGGQMIIVGEFKGYKPLNTKVYDSKGVLRGEFINGKFIKP